MIIYADILVIINIYITYFSLKATARILHLGYKTKRIIAAAVLGGISALSAVIPLSFIPSVLIRFALTSAITIVAFGFPGIKTLVFRSMVNLASATLVCGITILLRECTGSDIFGAARGYPYMNISAVTLILATTVVYITITVFRRISDKPMENEIVKLKICHKGKTAEISAFSDSGNNLRDYITGKPVIICRKDKICELIPDYDNEDDFSPCTRLIPFSSVGGSGIITAFSPDSVTVCRSDGREKTVDVLIGTGGESLRNEKFDAILNPKILI